jgi:general secretion pathway protein D
MAKLSTTKFKSALFRVRLACGANGLVRHRWPSGVSILVWVVLAAVTLPACSQVHHAAEQGDATGPDVLDRVRSLDLLPRFPHEEKLTDNGSTSRMKAAVYSTEANPPEAAMAAAPGANLGSMPASPATPAALGVPGVQPGPVGDGYELNFENAPVASVAKTILGEALGVGYTIDPRVQGTVTLTSGRLVPKADLIYVLESALRPIGAVLVKDKLGYRFVPLGDAVGAGNTDEAAARAAPGYGVSVVPLQNVSAQTLVKLVDSFATRPGTVRADPAHNMLIIQGSGTERRSAIDTILSFDADWMRGQLVGIYPIQNSTPEPVLADLEKILDSGEGGLSQNVVKLQAISRMNAILAVARKPAMLNTISAWITRLDRTDTARSGVRVYRVKYGEARQMARILNEVFTGGGSGSDTGENQVAPGSGSSESSSGDRLSGSAGGTQSGFGSRPQSGFGTSGGGGSSGGFNNASLGGQSAGGQAGQGLGSARPNLAASALNPADDSRGAAGAGGAGGAGGPPLLQGVRITADNVNNTLLIYCTEENYQIIERTLRQIDRPQLQVAIDATIAEVTLNDSLSYGVQAFLTSHNLGLGTDKGSILNTSPTATYPTTTTTVTNGVATAVTSAFLNRAIPGFNFLLGSEAQPTAILDALHMVTDLKVLSNPSLVVIDNQVATLLVGDQVPVSTGSANVLNSATATSNTIVNSVDYRPTGIIVKVAPRINANGNVRLEIEQEISNVVTSADADSPASTAPNLTPTVSQRQVKSSIVVASGQTVLLAGLIQEQTQKYRAGIPVLDSLPEVGNLFSHTTKTAVRTELIMFIRPQIIRDGVDAYSIAEELRTKMRGKLDNGLPQVRGP